MYCPNCGVEINTKGAYCAKCRKNIAYLTEKKILTPEDIQLEELIKNATLDEPLILDENLADASPQKAEEIPLPPAPKAVAEEKGYYCNHCGTFVYPEDNYCYFCGKKTQKKYYQDSSYNSKKTIIFLSAIIVLGAIFLFGFFYLN